MKKLSMICAAALFAGLLAGEAKAQDTVTSVNVVGFSTEVLPQSDWILVSAPFTQVDGTTNTLESVFSTNNLAKALIYTQCDRIVLWNTGTQAYEYWAQRSDTNGFYKAGGVEWFSKIRGNPEVPPGTAFWISPAGNASGAHDINFSGQVVDVATQSLDIVSGFQLLSFPFSSDIALTNTTLAAQGTAAPIYTSCDRVMAWNGSTYDIYGIHSDGKWRRAGGGAEWFGNIPATNTLGLNQGFWYDAKSAFTWEQPNPYIGSL